MALKSRALGRIVTGELQGRMVAPEALGSGRLSLILQQLGRLHPVASLPGDLPLPANSKRRSGSQPAAYRLDPVPREELAEAYQVEERALELGVPMVSLIVPEEDLAELEANSLARGREWERAGWLAYISRRRLEFSSGVGVRVHGGTRRDRAEFRSWRLYFRSRYGFSHFAPEIFPSRAARPPRQIVIRRDSGPDRHGHQWRFANPLGMDIARRVGVPAPETWPAIFYLNGKLQGTYVLTEYIQRDFLSAHFGHDNFDLIRTKRNRNAPQEWVKEGAPEHFERFQRWVEDSSSLTAAKVAKRVDLDNLTRWILVVSYCATGDFFQGSLVLDRSVPQGRWFWIAWDLDLSFGLTRPGPERWRRDFMGAKLMAAGATDLRAILFRKLVATDPEYRRFFISTYDELMNHRLTPEFVNERFAYYKNMAEAFEAGDLNFLDELRAFLDHREPFLQDQLREHLGAGRRYRVQVLAGGRELGIDGHLTRTPWTGNYFDGTEIELRATRADEGGLSHWLVDGTRRVAGPVFREPIRGDHTVRAVFDNERTTGP